MAVKLNQHDLQFILKQIKIAEAHAAGTPLDQQIAQPHLPYGLRTVDGSYNNLIEGRELWGASDQIMPRMLDPEWLNEQDENPIDLNGPAPGGQLGNTDYGADGDVVDTDPRIITNLISDQTLKNPAVIIAALQYAEYNPAANGETSILEAVASIQAEHDAYVDAAGAAVQAAIEALAPGATAAQKAAAAAAAIASPEIAGLKTALYDRLSEDYGIEMDGNSVVLPNVAPDEGLSAPFNGWMTFFGQFFDHGLDLIHKGDNGTIFVPLAADDPLRTHGPDGIAGSGDEVPASRAFMAITRLKPEAGPGADGVLGTADDTMEAKNKTTPFVDQNQTYTSHPSHQVFLREYKMVDGKPMATGHLLDGANGGLATWADVKKQAAEKLGIQLTDYDIIGVPLLRTDPYGEFIRDANGFPQVVYNVGPDGIPNTADDLTASGTPDAPLNLTTLNGGLGPVRTSHQFLDDIANNANPFGSGPSILQPDIDTETDEFGNPLPPPPPGTAVYDNELLDRHFITGDGRGNENIGLTAVHHVFHSEHNRQVEDVKKQIIEIAQSGRAADVAFLNEWLLVDVAQNVDLTDPNVVDNLQWDGERLFQTGRFATEMQYQHLVFEEFGRKIQPNIDLFVFNTITDVNPAIFAEFAHTVYRFGHSMLTDHLKLLPLDANGNPVGPDGNPLSDTNGDGVTDAKDGWGVDVGLIEAFLNPVLYDRDGTITPEQAAGAIIRGMTYVHGNAIDEFTTESLRNNLLGLPLDLAAINIARGRDAGVPSLNEAREQLYAASNSSWLKPYESWADFGANLKTPASIINFLAAYGTHPAILNATTLEEKREAAMELLGFGESSGTSTQAATLANASFETDSLASGQPGVITHPNGNYTTSAPTGWTLTGGEGGLIDPANPVINQAGIDGTAVAWIRNGAVLSQTTGLTLEEGASYRLTVDVGDRADLGWPGGQARLVDSNGNVLASVVLPTPVDGNWSTVTLETAVITPAQAGLGLRIEIVHPGGTGDQILIDDVRLDIVRPSVIEDRLAFLNGTGAWAGVETGLNHVDLWIGGLAERIMPFGGMLGSTFNAVFELQMENLQEGDRFYYLSRTQGLNFLTELEDNTFSKMIMANTDLTQPGPDGIRGTDDDVVTHHIGVDSFAKYDGVIEVSEAAQIALDPEGDDPFMNAIRPKVQRNDPNTPGADTNYLRFTGGEHMVMGGTEYADTIIGGDGDDGIWGGNGDDRIEGGHGVDLVIGGAGDDIITDSGDTGDFLKGGSGDDVIANSNGLDVLMGGDGKDVFLVGVDATEVFGGEGNDFMLGGLDHDFLIGGEGDDWMEGGDGFDILNGDNSELFFNSTILGHDVMFAGENENDFDAESGDDIMVQGESVMRNEGMFGFDWAIYKGSAVAADADMRIPFFTTVFDDILRDRFDQTEALSGWIHNDMLRGDDRGADGEIEVEFSLENHGLTQAGVNRIDGLRNLLGISIEDAPTDPDVDLESVVAWAEGNLLLGGDGSDTFEGRGADDFIHGDAWLNVRIRIVGDGQANTPENELATVDTLKHVFTQAEASALGLPAGSAGKSLSELLLARAIKPGQMHIVREIKYAEDASDDTDTAIFAGNRDWYEITQVGDRTYVARRENENIDPAIDEGTDTLIGIERIQFADGMYTIRETGNVDPTGRLTITGLPAREGQMLTVSADQIRDLNNPDGRVSPNSISFRWQIERNDGTGDYIDIPGARGNTFTPTNDHDGLRIRVLGTYVDGGGVTEIVSSQPTDPVGGVNDGPTTGGLLISDMSPTEGQPLTATIAFTDPDGMTDAFEEGLLSYQWQFSADGTTGWQDVPAESGGNDRSFVPGAALVGQHLRMRVVYQDDLLNEETVYSEVTEIVGNHIQSDAAAIDAGNGDSEGGTTVGDDFVVGGAGNNTVDAGAGNDTANGGGGNDVLNGGTGDDTLNGGAGDDAVNGGDGNDTIIHGNGQGSDAVNGGAGQDRLRIVESVMGNPDTVTVTLSGSTIAQVNGTTVTNIEANELDLGGGTDRLVYDTAGNVTVNLLSGAATGFSLTRGVENVTSGGGNDVLTGNSLDNNFDGGGGRDILRGGFGDDTLLGAAGNDDLYGEDGNDLLNGGDGDDRIDGGAGVDTASYAGASAGVTVSLLGQNGRPSFEEQPTIGAGTDRLIDIENLVGSAHNDTLTGNAGANLIDGGAGADAMAGGAGDDTYVVDNTGDQVTEGANAGADTVRSSLANYVLGNNVENLVLAEGAFNGEGNALDNRFTGNAGNNVFEGWGGIDTLVLAGGITSHTFAMAAGTFQVTGAGGGTDTLGNRIERVEFDGVAYTFVRGTNGGNTGTGAVAGGNERELLLGFGGNDVLNGNGGDDILDGGIGADAMNGGAGNDTYIVAQAGDRVNETGGDGTDTILSAISISLDASGVHVDGAVENLVLTGTGNNSGTGTAQANEITGNSGNNALTGAGGNDILIGNAGTDNLLGGDGDDVLEGGAGNDGVNGGAGTDTAVFAGAASDYTFDVTGTGLARVIHRAGGNTDTLTGIEQIRFGDGVTRSIVTGGAVATGASIIFGTAAGETIIGSSGGDIIIGGVGDDVLNGHDLGDADDDTAEPQLDDDIFLWSPGDGTDIINGGTEGTNGDLFQIVGNTQAETYRIYTYDEAVARIGFAGSDESEIVVTRQVAGGAETVIAELTEIEEIMVNGGGVSGNTQIGGDTIEMYGNFDVTTSLRPDTITIQGSGGNDTVNISSLLSNHRIVFKGAGGNDTIVGTLRPQDVVELLPGKTIDDYVSTTNPDGSTTISTQGHSITFRSDGGLPGFQSDTTGSALQQPPAGQPPAQQPPAGQTTVLPGVAGFDAMVAQAGAGVSNGSKANDVMSGGAGNDVILAGSGNDEVMGGAGNDLLHGDVGRDRLFGEGGNDLLRGGAGGDELFGGEGNDTFLAEAGDANDTYHGDNADGGFGSDTLDMSSILANITADLGSRAGKSGLATSSETGRDILYNIENIVTGSGDDQITASDAVNVMDGGDGKDVFRFLLSEHADGDTIVGFQPGDRIDLASIDANIGLKGNQNFTLVSGALTGAGQVMVSQEVREDGAYTVLSGNTDNDDEAEFSISIRGTHQITEAQLGL